ncbi:unannotated protein [freshwater metagenome]|uniref:Unannotated protein n=1 Tax=freshwater metagenome TaxID=449393 RepID=A0A6J6LQP1_9ZZZZ
MAVSTPHLAPMASRTPTSAGATLTPQMSSLCNRTARSSSLETLKSVALWMSLSCDTTPTAHPTTHLALTGKPLSMLVMKMCTRNLLHYKATARLFLWELLVTTQATSQSCDLMRTAHPISVSVEMAKPQLISADMNSRIRSHFNQMAR